MLENQANESILDTIDINKEGNPTNEARLVSKAKLLEAGTYFGHKTFMWNPKMKPYIHSKRPNSFGTGSTHVIDLEKTQKILEFAYDLIFKYAQKDASFIFVGTRPQASETIKENALRSNSFYVSTRWLGGSLTNHTTIHSRVYRLLQLEKMKENNFEGYTKKEAIGFTKELEKLEKNLSGIRNMKRLPNVMIVADPSHDKNAVLEARKKGLRIIGIVDTNVDPSLVDVIIPANDDSKKSVTLIMTLLADAIVQAKGGEVKFAYKKDEEIVLPVEPKKIRTPREFKRGEDRFKRHSTRHEENAARKDVKRNEREAQAGQAQIDNMNLLSSLSLLELKEKAKQKEIKGFAKMNKPELIQVLKGEQS